MSRRILVLSLLVLFSSLLSLLCGLGAYYIAIKSGISNESAKFVFMAIFGLMYGATILGGNK